MSSDPMQAFAEYATPGPPHAMLTLRVGRWDLVVRFYQSDGVVGFESRGESSYAWILGGRVLENLVIGDPSGRPFEGRGYSGFDTRLHRYWFVWFDSMGTGVMRGEGRAGSDGSSIEWNVEATDVLSAGTKRARSVERVLSADEWMAQTFDIGSDGREFVRTEFHYRRKA